MKRLHDRNEILFDRDLYRHRRDELHVHFRSSWPVYLAYGPYFGIGRAGVYRGADLADIVLPNRAAVSSLCQLSVLVRVGNFFECSGPIASAIRLKRLDRCYMAGMEPLKLLRAIFIEVLFVVFNWKLGSILNAS